MLESATVLHGEEKVFIGLGSNLGQREDFIQNALHEISKFCKIVQVSSFVESKAAINIDQPDFINCVAEISTSLLPRQLMSLLLAIEYSLGRRRRISKGPRSIDIDLLYYGNRIIETKFLMLPHPGIFCRDFVVKPLRSLVCGLSHPVTGQLLEDVEESSLIGKIKI